MDFDFYISALGLVILLFRTQPWKSRWVSTSQPALESMLVSVVIPCRNEEHNIGPLLESLVRLAGIRAELIVVDDDSEDQTVARALQFPQVKVVKAERKPDNWVGKSWACWQGAKYASGDFLLFTDADTRHSPASLVRAVEFLLEKRADLISAPPFHLCQNAFEKFLGLFHLLPMIAAPILPQVDAARVYAIGQYLLFRREAYFEIGGHETVATSLTEDLDFANAVILRKLNYSVYPDPGLYQVQMYDHAAAFAKGWIRLLRLGMKKVNWLSFVDVSFVFYIFTHFSAVTILGILSLAWIQKKHGNFSTWGAPVAVVSLVIFTVFSVIGLVQNIFRKKVIWHERSYSNN